MTAAVRALALVLVLCVLVALAAVKLARRAVRRRAQGGLPGDGQPLSPCMDDRWSDLAGRYYESTATEHVYPDARRPWWRRRHLGAVVVVRAASPERSEP